MIPLSDTGWQVQSWQEILADSVTTVAELTKLLDIEGVPLNAEVDPAFPLFAPRPYLARIEQRNGDDPLLLQILPTNLERAVQPGFSLDPLDERATTLDSGLMSKYRGRVLILAAGTCAINCRFCFRRHFPYDEHKPSKQDWQAIFAFIEGDESIHEVILSGGDPLVINDQRLAWVAQRLAAIRHLKRLRIHTRLPIAIPQRVCDSLLQWMAATTLQTVLVTHCNHPRELDDLVLSSLLRLRQCGVTLLNQSVLLKGINDDADVIVSLSERLFEAGVHPYYLHLLDRVQGAGHFWLSDEEAQRIYHEAVARLPGYLLPRLVREVPGARAKMPADGFMI
jgi:EF-P beta-lysylation protein EpmB|tara:strand:- start:12350 stop:13363 length:1014 start_codon:yes stop_codon:yes gene_type:complete